MTQYLSDFTDSFRGLLPATVSVSAVCGSDPILQEMKVNIPVTQAMSTQRSQAFIMGRLAAQRALRMLGQDASLFLERGKSGEPLWPNGVHGSITHTSTMAFAAAALTSHSGGLGIDIEPVLPSEEFDSLVPHFASESEAAWIYSTELDRNIRATALFSSKESLFKAANLTIGKYFGFMDAIFEWNDTTAAFSIASGSPLIKRSNLVENYSMRVSVAHDFVLSVAVDSRIFK